MTGLNGGVVFFYIFDTKFVFPPNFAHSCLFYMPFLSQFLFCFRGDHIKPS